MTQTGSERVPFSDLPGFSELFNSYCTDFERVSRFYRWDWRRQREIAASAEVAASHSRDRETLVEVLLDQNRRWDARDGSLRNIERLADPRSVAVVTGQQVGLFTGPMYTLLKTITAIRLARRIEAETDRPCVPVFWLEGEDHDFEEAASIHIPGREELTTLRLSTDVTDPMVNTGPVGRMALGEQIGGIIDRLEEAIPPTEFRDDLIAGVRALYKPESSIRDAFAGLMRQFFRDQGLVFVSPDDIRLKKLLIPLFRQEISDYATSYSLLKERTEELADSYSPQIHPHPMNLFILEEEGRIRLQPVSSDAVFSLRGLDRSDDRDDLLSKLENDPRRFSPNVVLRPISQDQLLPTVAYVAGPSEVSYFAQLGPVYEWAGVPMPVIYPRASVTLVEGHVRKAMEKLDLSFTALAGDTDAIIRDRTLSEMDFDLDALFAKKAEMVERDLADVKELAATLDASLVKSVESAMTGIHKQLDTMKTKLVRAAKRNHDQIGQSVEKAADGLFPQGKLQERVVSPLYFTNKYGPDLPERLLDMVSLEVDEHQVIDI